MRKRRPHKAKTVPTALFEHRLVRFVIIGGVSFGVDLGLLIALHEAVGLALWIATPIAFLVSLVFNFLLQRNWTFNATNKAPTSALMYGMLVGFNVLATDVIVLLFAELGLTYTAGKVVATVTTMTWNFFLYKFWIFPGTRSAVHSSSVGTR